MKIVSLLLVIVLMTSLQAIAQEAIESSDKDRVLVFQDDFNRNESQETKDEPGNGWKTNSEKRAAGNKQVDLKDGAMYIYRHADADHGVSVVHDAAFTNGCVEIKFMLENEKDTLGLNFADLKFKEVHAGHLFKSNHRHQVLWSWLIGKLAEWTSRFVKRPDRRRCRTSKKNCSKRRRSVSGKNWKLASGILPLQLFGEKNFRSRSMGKEVGAFSSAGIAHPTKRTLRLAVNRKATVDDLKVYALSD